MKRDVKQHWAEASKELGSDAKQVHFTFLRLPFFLLSFLP
jgi:hypothetical protein